MQTQAHLESVRNLLHSIQPQPVRGLALEVRPLAGGLESAAVLHVTARYRDAADRARSWRVVIKELEGDAAREAVIYERLVAPHAKALAPRLLGVERHGQRHTLYLEAIRRGRVWPWSRVELARQVVEQLAHLHTAVPVEEASSALPRWDYDTELQASAQKTQEILGHCRYESDLAFLTRSLPELRRLVAALPAIRRQLLGCRPFGRAPIHGDMHPGNALVRRRDARDQPVLLDWGRARIGSPLEDVSAWLQTLGYWEPEARRRHDTLLAGYLSARGMERKLTSRVREPYWLAGASNVLSGALLYHLVMAKAPENVGTAQQARSVACARDWLRVIRRASAFWS